MSAARFPRERGRNDDPDPPPPRRPSAHARSRRQCGPPRRGEVGRASSLRPRRTSCGSSSSMTAPASRCTANRSEMPLSLKERVEQAGGDDRHGARHGRDQDVDLAADRRDGAVDAHPPRRRPSDDPHRARGAVARHRVTRLSGRPAPARRRCARSSGCRRTSCCSTCRCPAAAGWRCCARSGGKDRSFGSSC